MDNKLVVHPRDRQTFFNRRWRLEHFYKIKTENAQLETFKLNDIQNLLFAKCEKAGHRKISIIQAKSRKHGVSTFWELYFLDDTLFYPNTTTYIQAHTSKDVQKLFRIVKLAYEKMPKTFLRADGGVWVRPEAKYDNKNELFFEDINSTIYVGLEERGGSPKNVLISEAAHHTKRERILATLASTNINSVANKVIESTSNGVGDWFQETYDESRTGDGPYEALFFAWWQKKANRLQPPEGWRPSAAALEKANMAKERYGVELTPEQLFWWEQTKKEQKKLMDQEHPTTDDESFMISGSMAIDGEVIRKLRPRPPIRIWRKVLIWKEPEPGREYVLGGDPAEGVGGDNSAIEVIDAETLEQVAEYASNTIKPAKFAKVVARVGRYFNEALAVVERNNHGHAVLDRLKDIYDNIYRQAEYDKVTQKTTKRLGFRTDGHTRDLILDSQEEVIEEGSATINSAMLKSELQTFVKNEETNKREAKEGKHDDRVMAHALAIKVARTH